MTIEMFLFIHSGSWRLVFPRIILEMDWTALKGANDGSRGRKKESQRNKSRVDRVSCLIGCCPSFVNLEGLLNDDADGGLFVEGPPFLHSY